MQTTTQLYWLTRLDGISTIFTLISILSFVASLISLIFYLSEKTSNYCRDEDLIKGLGKYLKYSLILFSFSTIISILTPTKNDVVFIIAGGKTIDFIKNDTSINKIPAQTTKIITDYLDKQIKETK